MSNTAFETLVERYPNYLTDKWVTNLHHDTPAFVIYQADTLHQNTIDDSNVETIYDELVGMFPQYVHKESRPYVDEVYVYTDDLRHDEELAEHVLEVLEALDNYPVFNEQHYYDLEHERLVEYMSDQLVSELAYELDRDDDEELAQWVRDNVDIVWEHNDGSVDDVPFNVEAIAALVS